MCESFYITTLKYLYRIWGNCSFMAAFKTCYSQCTIFSSKFICCIFQIKHT